MTPGTLTRRLCGATLIAQALSVALGALVAWRLASVEGDALATVYVLGGLAIALLCLLAAGALRGRAGVALGWAAQVLTLAYAVVLPAMLFVGLLFGGLWWVCLVQGRRMDRVTAERDAAAAAQGEGA